ncbi:U2 small nuclear ribonucleoprotein auxiliary factor 35 kDa subunit-related protein 1 [Anopheles moucheti]|uniref:U2 small nuclear ribonucleoprotein auxiliary factor 35 kDa subunit-related protein 1 n=1 Tax=Anopheles moucheti TaxID=186751 RepID=UPI0022F0ABB0|nr:U2 small nuclear ribonucleoprotein auxiliary factor 35 kDa subunit-related protein 1 [Anopheles moucheti]
MIFAENIQCDIFKKISSRFSSSICFERNCQLGTVRRKIKLNENITTTLLCNKDSLAGGIMRHREWRKLFKKRRRKAIRQKAAQAQARLEAEEEERKLACPEYQSYLVEKERQEKIATDRKTLEHALQNAIWLEEEHKAQLKFEALRRKEEAKERDEQEKREKIRKEFEDRECKVKQAKAERLEQQELVRRMLYERHVKLQEFAATGVDEYLHELQSIHSTRSDAEDCKFFLKTGACRHGYRCSGNHPTPGVGKVILIPSFFSHPALEQKVHAEYGQDVRLEFDEDDLQSCYNDFFRDIIVEFEAFGKIQHILACRNAGTHLRGSVYIEYELLRNAAAAYLRMNGRFYAKKQLHVEFRSPIVWPAAVCGLFELKRCQKGNGCNFLHILKNPDHRYVYNHFQECRSMRKEEIVHVATPLVEKTWDEITSNGGQSSRKASQWRWSESPELEVEKSDTSKILASVACIRHDDDGKSKKSSHQSREKPSHSSKRHQSPKNRHGHHGSTLKHSRSRTRSRSRSHSRNRKHSVKDNQRGEHKSRHRYAEDNNHKRDRRNLPRLSNIRSPSRKGTHKRNKKEKN